MDHKTSQSDAELLGRFARSRDEQAFEALVLRHMGLVLGAARRRLPGRAALAEDVAQRVFLTLARKAGRLRTHPCLPAWLQKTAAFEALRAARKEQNHAKTMSKLHSELASDGDAADTPHDRRFDAALPMLDEALASLGEGDRRAVMLRFYEGKSFKAIAQLCGKTEAATQKQARRAIDKLGGLLGRRGLAVPAAVLASGLTAELGKAAPAEVATSVAGSVMGQVSSGVAGGATAAIGSPFALMNAKTAFAIGAAVLIACAGIGYVAGRAARPDTASSTDSSGSKAGGGQVATVAGKGGVKKREDADTLRKLLGLASAELARGEYDVAANARARARVASIPREQIQAALGLVSEMRGGFDGEAALTDVLLTHWAKFEGRAACEFMLAKRKPPSREIPPLRFPLTEWAGVDPAAALEWYLNSAEGHPALNEGGTGMFGLISNIRWVFAAWAQRDVGATIAAYRSLETDKHRQGAFIGLMEHAGAIDGREQLLAAFAADENEYMRRDNLRDALNAWSRHRPEELARWVDANPVDGGNSGHFSGPVLANWLVAEPDAAVDWWMRREAEGGKSRQVQQLMKHWGESDLSAASEWLSAQELGVDYDKAISEISMKATRREPASALAWATRISEEAQRNSSLRYVVRAWARSDSVAARAGIEAADIEAGAKAELLELVAPKSEEGTR